MQRLFSTFASGWPGIGLLLQRCLAAILLIRFGFGELPVAFSLAHVSSVIAVCASILLLIGLWTPFVGASIAVAELWIAATQPADPTIPAILAVLAGTVAMIGPGAWSIDARLFGRKHIAA